MSSNDTDQRAAFLAGLRAFADLVENDPSIPTPTHIDVWAHISAYGTGLDQDRRFELAHDFADAHGVAVRADYKGDRSAEKRFGPVEFRVCAYADKQPDAHVVTRPGKTRAPEHATA